ncbi:hypothetical protein BpHYR1_032057 [Brachionus plicatilis]|uniref:Uncharacterized protein n=1 Tax=Brachionus plicatilis TaxID=10195 RepID=A0A3M7QAR1_BRAPC|nr:hypothetical protein BpHYR1_032057 [Brachionus plicatilis]
MKLKTQCDHLLNGLFKSPILKSKSLKKLVSNTNSKVTCAKCLSIDQFRKERRNSKIAITQWSWVFSKP